MSKTELDLRQVNDVAVFQYLLHDAPSVDEGPVRAVKIPDRVAIADPDDERVVLGDAGGVHDVVRRIAATQLQWQPNQWNSFGWSALLGVALEIGRHRNQ